MGQQQLLLLVLGIVIVGLAVVVGIQAFSDGAQQAEIDAATMDAVRIASLAQAWAQKPTAFGGNGATSATVTPFAGLELGDLGLSDPYVTANGSFTITVNNAGADFDVDGDPTNAPYTVEANVTGIESDDITTTVAPDA